MPPESYKLKNRLMSMTSIILDTEKKLIKVRKDNKLLRQENKKLKSEIKKLNESKQW